MAETTPLFAKKSNVAVLVEITGEDYKFIEKLFIVLYNKEKQL